LHRFRLVAAAAALATVSLAAGAARAGESHVHDGFQFRGTVGLGFMSDSESDDTTVHGGAGAFELYFGGMPIRGLAIGGFVSGAVAPGPSLSADGVSVSDSNSTLTLFTVGPYIDWYPHAHEGFHLLGTLGYANLKASYDDGNLSASNSAGGFTLGGGIGYDWWVSRDWSLGILGRFTYAQTSRSIEGVSFTQNTVVPAVLFSFSFN
jgi:hypothetical protein